MDHGNDDDDDDTYTKGSKMMSVGCLLAHSTIHDWGWMDGWMDGYITVENQDPRAWVMNPHTTPAFEIHNGFRFEQGLLGGSRALLNRSVESHDYWHIDCRSREWLNLFVTRHHPPPPLQGHSITISIP